VPLFRRAGPPAEAAGAAEVEQQASIEQLLRGGLPRRAEQRMRETAGGPFTSGLSVDEFVLAGPVGLRPVAQVMGSSVYHVGWQRTPGGWSWQAGSQELTVLSEAWNELAALPSRGSSVKRSLRVRTRLSGCS
jgi:hypothetical protein